MPKAPAFPEDEKTTLESGWEEEASTTVEQGEVASKIRALAGEPQRGNGVGSITSTGNSVVDEPTVDDQRANAAISLLTPPNHAVARLVVTQGNDAGQQLEITPGKTLTIGRAIDNDFVLTDIAVSRKHFDLRPDGVAWILEDRRSGNGTLVNGNLEDQPFVLANGDLIEIGNTTFRFEQANAPPRPARPAPVAGAYELDEEEQSTVAGKPIRHEEVATPAQLPPPTRLRPKTVPPPAPLPRRGNGVPPPVAYPMGSVPSVPSMPARGLPGLPPHMVKPGASAPPQLAPVPPPPPPSAPQPQVLQPPRSQPQPQMLPPKSQPQPQVLQPPRSQPQPQMLPHGMMQPQPLPATTLPLPQMQGRPSPMGPHAPTMHAPDGLAPRPGLLPTTIPGQGPPAAPSQPHLPYSYPSVSDMHKHAHMLVVGNGQPRDATSTALVQPTPFGVVQSTLTPTVAPPTFSRKTKLLLAGAALTLLAAFATIAIIKSAETKGDPSNDPGLDPGSGSGQTTITPIDPAKPDPAKPDPALAKPDPAKPDPAKPDPTKPDPTKPDPAKPDPTNVVDPPKPDPDPPKPDPDPSKPDPTADDPKGNNPKGNNPKGNNPKGNNPKGGGTRVGVATVKQDTSGVRNRAIELYRNKRFKEAAELLNQAANTISGKEASDLRTKASSYRKLGEAYNRGMAPATPAVDAYNDLKSALSFDTGQLAGEFATEIRKKLAVIAPKAAVLYYARKDYFQAFQAARTAEANGVQNGDTKLVRTKLEDAAKVLYDQAAKEINTNPEAAKVKLKQIRGMVEATSPTLAKANALLNAN